MPLYKNKLIRRREDMAIGHFHSTASKCSGEVGGVGVGLLPQAPASGEGAVVGLRTCQKRENN